jgi:putative transposase
MPNAHTRTSNIELTDTERAELTSMARSRSLPAALALRARIVLACEGPDKASTDAAKALGIDRNTVNKWRGRYARGRLSGLYDELRPGRPRTVDDERVAELIKKTLHTKPADGATHWSTRGLAAETGISKTSVARYLKAFQLKPHRVESFKLSTDPLFIEKLRDVVGLYLNPPENALVLCVDEKSQCQALERTQPMLPMGLATSKASPTTMSVMERRRCLRL